MSLDSSYDEEELTKEIGHLELEEIQRHPLFERYHCNSSIEPRAALKLIVASEQRKEAMRLRIHESREKEQKQWLRAKAEYDQIFETTSYSCSAAAAGQSSARSVASPDPWVSFDDIFALQFNKPMETAIASLSADNHAVNPPKEDDTLRQAEETPAGLLSEPETSDEVDRIVCSRQTSDDVGSLIGQYVRGISFRAKHLVEGLTAANSSKGAQPSPPTPSRETIFVGAMAGDMSPAWGNADRLQDFYGVEPSAAAEYVKYTSDLSRFAESVDDEESRRTKAFYLRSCCGLHLDADDLTGMEHLSERLGVYSTMKEGVFAGMPCSSSAIESTGTVALAALYLERHISSEQNDMSSLLLDEFCKGLEHINGWGLTPGQQNEVINTSLQRVYQRRSFGSFVEPERLESAISSWTSPAAVQSENPLPSHREPPPPVCKHQGFVSVGSDKYVRLTNQHMVMNDACASSFSALCI